MISFPVTTNRGIALFLAVVFISVGLAVVLGLSGITFGEFRMARDARDSQRALYIADSGIECMLQAWRDEKLETPTVPANITCFGKTFTLPAVPDSDVTVRNVLVSFTDGTCVDLEVTRDATVVNPDHTTYLFAARGQTSCAAGVRSVQVGVLWMQE